MEELEQAARAALVALEVSKNEMLIALESAQKLAGYAITDAIISRKAAEFQAHERAIEDLKKALAHRL
jgi:hypothetical protein